MTSPRNSRSRRPLTIERIAARPSLVVGLSDKRTRRLILQTFDVFQVLVDHLTDLTERRARKDGTGDLDPDRVLQ